MVAAVVQQGEAVEQEVVGQGVQDGDAVLVQREVDVRELVGLLAGLGADMLGARAVDLRQEVDGDVLVAQDDAVGVVGL